MDNGRRVVVVDGLPETEEVLKAVLEPRGFEVSRTRRLPETDDTPVCQPPLLVLHQEESSAAGNLNWPTSPAVIIGRIDLPAAGGHNVPDHCRMLSQPFHYAELVNAIDRLLEHSLEAGESATAA